MNLLVSLEARSFWEMMLWVMSEQVFGYVMRQCMSVTYLSCCVLMRGS